MKTMSYSVWLDCRVQERISGHQGGRWRLRIASEFTVSTQNRKGTQGGERKWILIARLKFLCTDPELSFLSYPILLIPSGNRTVQMNFSLHSVVPYLYKAHSVSRERLHHGNRQAWSCTTMKCFFLAQMGRISDRWPPCRFSSSYQLTTLVLSQSYIQFSFLFNWNLNTLAYPLMKDLLGPF